jgi:hypothetical protein
MSSCNGASFGAMPAKLRHCEGQRPVAIQRARSALVNALDCHGATLLAMTKGVKNLPRVCANARRVCMNLPCVCANTRRVCMNPPCVYTNARRVCMNLPCVCANALRVCMNPPRVCANTLRVCMNLSCVCANARRVCTVLIPSYPLLKGVPPCPPLTGYRVAVKHKSP